MKILVWNALASSNIFGTMEEPKTTSIIPIAHTQDASEYIGISLDDNVELPTGVMFVTDIEPEKYYFFYSPIDGYWLTRDLIGLALKKMRQIELDKLMVNVNGFDLDANEAAQNRMSRAIISMNDDDIITWKGFHNTFGSLTKSELQEALKLAGIKQTELWVKYSL